MFYTESSYCHKKHSRCIMLYDLILNILLDLREFFCRKSNNNNKKLTPRFVNLY